MQILKPLMPVPRRSAPGAADVQQVGRDAYLKALNGKKVIFVPISEGFDLNQAWVTVWQRHAARYGRHHRQEDCFLTHGAPGTK